MLRGGDIYKALIAILAGYAVVGADGAQNNSKQAADLLEKAYLAATQYPRVAYNADTKSSEMRFSVTYYQRGRELDIAVMRHDMIDGEEKPVLKARDVGDGSRMIHYDTLSIEGPLRPQRVNAYFTNDKGRLALLRARSSTCAHLDGWSEFDHEHLSESMKNADTLVLLDEMETVGANACYVLESSGPRGHHKVWIDPEHGYHIRKAFIEKKADDLYGNDTVADVGNSSFKTLIEVVKFENVDGVWFPVEATEDRTWGTLKKDGTEEFRNVHETTTRSNVRFNPDFETLGAFVMDLPDGTTLQNLEFPGAQYVWINGAIRPYVEHYALDIEEIGTVPGRSLAEKLVDVTVAHIKSVGPDEDVAQFIAVERFTSWERREEIATATIPYLKSKTPSHVAGALAVLYRLRSYRPLHDIGPGDGSPTAWEQKYQPGPFWAKLDQQVIASFEHVHSLGDTKAFHNLALYLGVSQSPESKRELLRIASETFEKEQALISLAWHRDEKDMESLLPFMLGESHAAWNLPYHFRNSYGRAAIPYLKRALEEAESAVIRQRVAYELVHLRVPEGFRYLRQVALADPEPEERTQLRPLEGIRQFAVDYLTLPKDTREPATIAAHIAKKERELCRSEDSGEEK